MESQIFGYLIAFVGVVLSVLVSYVTGRRSANIEIQKMRTEIQQEFSRRLFEKRMDVYPILYSYLSDFTKVLQFGNLSQRDVDRLFKSYQEWDSLNAILFSARTGKLSYDLRLKLSELTKMTDKQFRETYGTVESLKELRKQIQQLELALKSELGIYGFESPTNVKETSRFSSYEEVSKSIGK